MSLTPGTTIGVYEVVALIGAGGMGEVYRARDTRLNRDVAIKILPDAVASDFERLARFTREAQTLASLNHPHIAAIYAVEKSAGLPVLVMELVEGEDLSQRIARGAIPLDDALPIARQIAEALEAAHEQGIIHRDLKPANIKLASDGTVKVLDFGLAKEVADETKASSLSLSPTTTSPAMTGSGIILGTAAYMSPEQAKGKPVDERADIWAFGCVLYEMLTGKRPFDGEDVTETIAAVVRGEPDFGRLPADTPEPLKRLLRRCLAKDRTRRLADIADARLDIEDASREEVQPNRPTAATGRGAWTRGAIALVALASVAAITASAFLSRQSPPPSGAITRFSVALDGQQFTNRGRQLVSISPDGSQFVYIANRRLWRRSMSDLASIAMPGVGNSASSPDEQMVNPVFSPDGQSVAYWSGTDNGLKRVPVTGGAAVTIGPASNPYGMTWDRSGIVFGQPNGVYRVSPNGGAAEPLVHLKPGQLADTPQLLPSGDAVLFTLATGTNRDQWDSAQVVVESLKTHERKVLIEAGSGARYVTTGHLVYAIGGVLYAVRFDPNRLETRGSAVPVVEGISRANLQQTGIAHFSIADNGTMVFVPGPVSGPVGRLLLARFDAHGGVESLNLPQGAINSPRASPDGRYLAFGNEVGKERSIWIFELSGASSMRRLTFGANDLYPIWTRDGKRIAFDSDRDGKRGIFLQKFDGSAQPERLTAAEEGIYHVPDFFLPDDDHLVFERSDTSTQIVTLWLLTLSAHTSVEIKGVTSNLALAPVLSPDGRWMAFQSSVNGAMNAYVSPFPVADTKYQITTSGGAKPIWSPDGKRLFFLPNPGTDEFAAVSIVTQPTFAFGKPEMLRRGWAETNLSAARLYDILPDGEHFIGVSTTATSDTSAPRINVVLNWTDELKQRVP